MASIHWANGVNGNWATGLRWAGGVAPGGGDTALISAAGTYTVTIDSAEAAQALTLDAVGATVADTGVLTIGGALTLTTGVFQLDTGGEVAGGTLSAVGGSFAWNGGTLLGVTYRGTLDLSAANASLIVSGGLTATGAGAGGAGAGLVDLTGAGAKLYVTGGETLDNATIDIGAASPGAILYLYDPTNTTKVLTLGSHLDVIQTGQSATIASDGFTGDTLVNDGTISAGVSGGTFDLTPFNLTNNGTIAASNGDTLFIDPTTFTEGSTGKLSATSGGTLELGYALTTAQLAKITDNGGIIGIAAKLTNTTLTVGPSAANPVIQLDNGGVIAGGTVVDKGSGIRFDGGELLGVTYDGALDLSADNATVLVAGGLTATTANGTGPGTINLTGGGDVGATFGAAGGETLDNATLNIGNANALDVLDLLDPNDTTPTLTLGSHFSIDQVGLLAAIDDNDDNADDTVVNDGAITAGVNGGFFLINPVNFTNNGTIAVSNGDDLFIDTPNFTEGANGAMSVASGGELDLGYDLTTAQLLQIANAGTIGIGGTLTNSGVLTVGPGTSDPALLVGVTSAAGVNGTIVGGTIVDKGSGVKFGGGTLSNVAYHGTLDLSAAGASVIVDDGFVARGEAGTGVGTIDVTGDGAKFFATGGETLNYMTVRLGSASGDAEFDFLDPTGGDSLLTLGSHFNIVQVGAIAAMDAQGFGGDTLVNDGTITAAVSGGGFQIEPVGNLTNNGAINVSNGDLLFLDPATFTQGATGAVSVSSGATLKLGFALTTAQLLSEFIDNDGVIGIAGALTNAGATLNVGAGTALPAVQLDAGGTIFGGTVADKGAVMQFDGGALSGVTYDGALNLATAGATLIVTGGLTATGAAGTGAGLIKLSGAGATLDAAGSETLDNATLDLGANGSFDLYDPSGASPVLTLGSGFSIAQTGAGATIGDSAASPTNTNDTIINDGTIKAEVAGGRLTIDTPVFANNGSLVVGNGEVVHLQPGSLTNLAVTTLTGGLYQVNAGSTLEFQNSTIATDNADIILNGAGSVIDSLDTSNNTKTKLESTLKVIAAAGTLEVLGGRAWTSTNAISDAGTLVLAGGAFSAASLANSGHVFGYGTIAAAVSNTGTVSVTSGKVLSLVGGSLTNLSGATLTGGTFSVGAAGTLQLANNTSIATLNATMELGAGTTVESLDTATTKQVRLESSLKTVGAQGVLDLLSGRGYSTVNAIANSGQIRLSGGTFAASKLSNLAGSTLVGFGAVSASLSNSGTVSVQTGQTLGLGGGATNLAGTTLTGGTWYVGSGGTLQLANNTSIATLNATMELGGAGTTVRSFDTATSKQVSLEATLTAIGATGVLKLLAARGYSTGVAINNAGTIELVGGAFTSGKLTDAAGSHLTGFGVVGSTFIDAGTVSVSGGSLSFTGKGDTFAGKIAGGALIFSGGSDAFNAGAALGVSGWTISNGAAVSVNTNLSDAGAVSQNAGTSLSIAAAHTLTLGANSTLAGAISGSGTLALGGGTSTLASGLTLSVAKLSVVGAATNVVLGSSRTYAGDFVQSTGTVKTGAFILTLSGPASFGPSAVVSGSGGLALQGATAISGLTIGGTEAVSNSGTVTATGLLRVGDSTTSAARFTNALGGVYDIDGNAGIGKGAAAGSLLTNTGTLAKTAGTGVSYIGVNVADTGQITIASGTLEFDGASNSFTGTANGAGTLAFGGGVNTLASGLVLTVAKLSVAGAAANVVLGSSRTYAGDFVQSAGTVRTGAFTLTLSGPASFGPAAVVSGSGGLALQGATAISGLTIGGTEAVSNSGTVTASGQLTVGDSTTSAAKFINASSGVYDIDGDTGIGKGSAAGSLFTNTGTLAKTAGTGVSHVGVDVTDTGQITIASGTLEFDGASNSFTGAVSGAGTFALGAGAAKLSALSLGGGVALSNAGTIAQSAVLTFSNGAVTNRAGAEWDFTTDSGGIALATGGSGAFTNVGTLAKTAGTGVTRVGVEVTDTGTITAATGALEFDGAADSFSGVLNGPGTVALDATASHLLTVGLQGGVSVTNAGAVSQSGVLTVSDGAVTNRAGAHWNLTSDNGISLGGSGGFTNAGTLAKTAGTGVSQIGVDVTDTGTITAATGTLEFDGENSSFAGALSGAGIVAMDGGADALTGVQITAAQLNITGAAVTLSGVIANSGAVTISGGTATVAAAGASLTGAGTISLSDDASNEIVGATAASVLTVDTVLEGAGQLGAGQLTLVNQSGGTIDAGGTNALTIDTGAHTVTNAGKIEAMGTGGLTINSAVDNTGTLVAGTSNLTVEGAVTGAGHVQVGSATLKLASTFAENVTFATGSTGTLELADSQAFTGTITGLSTTGANFLDLDDISYGVFTTATFSGTTAGGTLTVTDGTHTASIKLTGDYLGSTFLVAPDGHFGLLVSDPQASAVAVAKPSPQTFAGLMAGFGTTSSESTRLSTTPMQAVLALAHPASIFGHV